MDSQLISAAVGATGALAGAGLTTLGSILRESLQRRSDAGERRLNYLQTQEEQWRETRLESFEVWLTEHHSMRDSIESALIKLILGTERGSQGWVNPSLYDDFRATHDTQRRQAKAAHSRIRLMVAGDLREQMSRLHDDYLTFGYLTGTYWGNMLRRAAAAGEVNQASLEDARAPYADPLQNIFGSLSKSREGLDSITDSLATVLGTNASPINQDNNPKKSSNS